MTIVKLFWSTSWPTSKIFFNINTRFLTRIIIVHFYFNLKTSSGSYFFFKFKNIHLFALTKKRVSMNLPLLFRKFFLLAAMLGIEGCVAFEMILMLANVQTLGVPVSYSALPSTIGASFGMLLTPVLGVLTDKRATSKLSKAKILAGSVSLQMAGTLLVFTANCLKIFAHGVGEMGNVSTVHQHVNMTPHGWEPISALSDNPQCTEIPDLVGKRNVSVYSRLGYDASSAVKYPYKPLVLVGFGLIDFGNSISFCFFKTFILACVRTEERSSTLVKSSFAASLGRSKFHLTALAPVH